MTLPESEESCSDSPPSKKLKLDESPKETSSPCVADLLSFCDDLLLEILAYLRPTDLLALSQCCQRLNRVVCDRTLWEHVDFRHTQLTDRELKKFLRFFLPGTKLIATKGPWEPPPTLEWDGEAQLPTSSQDLIANTISKGLLEGISSRSPSLTSLILENHVLDCEDLNHYQIWEYLPSQLQQLALRSCYLTKCKRTEKFFSGISECLPQLKKLDLSKCLWFESHSLLALSKCKHLEELRLANCLLSDFVPYISLGTRFGFKSLTVVDFRRTWVSDREISCLNKMPTLQELYLESPGGERGVTLVSDLGVTAFGGTLEVWNEMGYFVVHFQGHNAEGVLPSPLRVIELSNYRSVTDTSLRHCASCLKRLEQLNVKGTSCSLGGVMKFRSDRPEVLLQSDFNTEVEDCPQSSKDRLKSALLI